MGVQVRVLATDNGFPARSATAIVVVDVLRNFFSPQWQQASYTTNVLETQSLGIPIIAVTAVDSDSQVKHSDSQVKHSDSQVNILTD